MRLYVLECLVSVHLCHRLLCLYALLAWCGDTSLIFANDIYHLTWMLFALHGVVYTEGLISQVALLVI